ncbi:hypothetical protein Clacol_002979 [Clathrus columnatus]|uniref:DDT domain-containing protein n=1 Tax=Clathrus columnatus TaxID=1419009 RepID=A0AAV5A3D0_9AGAM|nr:hypothetical protein Clacol_002979 [Clathrus columnatus]
MPTCRRKRVMLKELSVSLLEQTKITPLMPVFYMEQTGEIFEDYEFNLTRHVTGKSGLDYFQALESEQQEARTLHSRFPQQLKAPVLRAVQWQVVGRLDHLVEAVYERFKDRYFEGERVYVEIEGERYWATVLEVFPPRSLGEIVEPHPISGDLKLPVAEVNATNDPHMYTYKVQLIDDGSNEPETDSKGKVRPPLPKFDTTLHDVRCNRLSRDRLSFSKSILRRFIRDCVDRDAAVASPWTVKEAIAEKYGVENIMPEETRKGVEEVKNKEIEKRKKVWEDKEGPPTKKQKRMEEKAAKAREEERIKEEAAAAAAILEPPPKKKYIKYPTEDLDVVLSQREKSKRMAANGHTRSVRPTPSRDLPFPDPVFESLLMTFSFFTAFGVPLKLSPFTLDDFEGAIRHNDIEQPVTLIAEIHSSLIYALRALSTHRHAAVVSFLNEDEDHRLNGDEVPVQYGIQTDQLTNALAEVGNNWERQPLRVDEGRAGWEEALIGCVKDQATVSSFPTLRKVLVGLLFSSEPPIEGATPVNEGLSPPLYRVSPRTRYYLLPPEDKLALLSFLCDTVISHKEIHQYMETCETNLTLLRKEKIEIKKERKKIQDDMALLTKDEQTTNGTNGTNGNSSKAPSEGKQSKASSVTKDNDDGDQENIDASSDLSEVESESTPPDSDMDGSGTEMGSSGERGTTRSARQKNSASKVQAQSLSKQRELARAKNASAKQAQAEYRRLDEEDNKLERRMESIEREFRKWSGVVRLKPLGKDRFHNRYWWFDGIGSSSLVTGGGTPAYATGRLFVQGPCAADLEIMERRQTEEPTFSLAERKVDEEGPEGVLNVNEWGYYTEPEQLTELVAWLNTKGIRELKLKENLSKWADHIASGMRKRISQYKSNTMMIKDLSLTSRIPEGRRSTRKNAPDSSRTEPYLLWQNKKAPGPS